jgi:hypothetical protein
MKNKNIAKWIKLALFEVGVFMIFTTLDNIVLKTLICIVNGIIIVEWNRIFSKGDE